MAVTYQNRRGDVYRLLVGRTPTGKPKYYMAKSSRAKGEPVEEVPEGFEIYESPENATVVLRKAIPQQVTEAEQQFLEEGVRRLAGLRCFAVERAGDALVVYASNAEGAGSAGDRWERLFGPSARDWVAAQANYSKMLRFRLCDASKRRFTAERWCFRGSVENWIYVAGPADLATHAKKLLPHLNKESFFELY